MTGYGRGEAAQAGRKVAVELSSVNRRQAELALSLPRELESLESRIRERINQVISRGRVMVRITLQGSAADSRTAASGLNLSVARAAAKELRRVAKELRLAGEVTLETLIRIPGVLESTEVTDGAEALWPTVEKALDKALKVLVRMREMEGAHLAEELRERMTLIRGSVEKVRQWAPEVLARYREQLRERVRLAGLEIPPPDDERLLKELVYFADRSDITEELTRLDSHFAQFEETLRSREPAGRPLDFLVQEMNREVNTLGSKGNDSRISHEVVKLKTEIEKFREQAQNVE
jgi:uncharacterized protein (TIGR00255 family)